MSGGTETTDQAGPRGGHYEIEFRRSSLGSDDMLWRPMTVFESGGPPRVLVFETLEGAVAYVVRTEPDKTRIVLVNGEGGRQVVE